jgi:hypothetical protein
MSPIVNISKIHYEINIKIRAKNCLCIGEFFSPNFGKIQVLEILNKEIILEHDFFLFLVVNDLNITMT